ncbi:hypothetical protein [Caulobacter phage Cr30]|uniref:phosphoesterase n=1 Tax=Caulobacter phage Cr30 TaxID=1357714 RepID=UPI0004A9B630|nr:phosphoesterase [Caulobacter phage Cr30]AGS81151.1 hypothetical protein [Caulobacter phage Cr30]
MSNIFFASDLHLCHTNIVKFTDRESGERIRPYESLEEHDEILIQNWNKTVRSFDTVYVQGDICINKKGIEKVSRLHGRKILLFGNHDIFSAKPYLEHFDDVRGYKVFTDRKWVCSHIPIHKECIERWKVNIHGHLHSNIINDPEYLNVSMEQIQMIPLSIEDVERRIQMNIDSFQETGKVINFFHKHYEETYPNVSQ